MRTLTIKEGIFLNSISKKYVTEELSTSNSKKILNLNSTTGLTSTVSINAIVKIPNMVTQKTFEETDNNKGIIFVKNVDELIDSLES